LSFLFLLVEISSTAGGHEAIWLG
jgi:hypothetical protein